MKSKLNKATLFFLTASLSLLFPLSSYADSLGVNILSPSPSDAATQGMDAILDSLGVNKDVLDYYIGAFNSSPLKRTTPQVSLNFSPANPNVGDKVTVTATPSYFMNDSKNMYFTWFLKLKDCADTNSPSSAEREKCDLNGDGHVDIDDHKIRAMRFLANDDFAWENADYSQPNKDSSYKATFGGEDQKGKVSYCYVRDISSGHDRRINCNRHFFAEAPGERTGDGSFGNAEEKFWHTDPESADTAQTGNRDEANVAGLGETSFSWNYNSGDKVGVVVEGIGTEATHKMNSSYKTMFAASNGLCAKDSFSANTDANGVTTVVLTYGGGRTKTILGVSSLDACLSESLVSPAENNPGSDKLDVSLSYSPTSPTNDPGTYSDPRLSNGDELTVQSSINNATDAAYLQYSWQVFAGDNPAPDSWGSPIAKSNLPGASQLDGIGLTSFKFKLNLPNPKKYLNVKVTTKESSGGDTAREGHSNVVIPLNSNGNTLQAFATSTSGTDAPQVSMTDEICTDSLQNAVCPVAKDAIIGLKTSAKNMTNFLWTVNGKTVSYPTCFFNGCNSTQQTSEAYFPILSEVGSNYTVNLTAVDAKTGEKTNLSRVFQVVDPEVSIASADESVCKAAQLGNYVDLAGKKWADYSSNNLVGISNSTIKLKPVVAGATLDPSKLIWSVNGNVVNANSDGTLTLNAGTAGNSYTVSVQTIYAQSNPTKIALAKYWNVPYTQLYENSLSKSITLDIQDGTPTTAAAKTQQFMATIYTGTPTYLAFLLRMALTLFLILFSSQLMLLFFPRISTKD